MTKPSPVPRLRPASIQRGILLVALGAAEYGSMAVNLAASIRMKDPDVSIHLVHTAQSIAHLTPAHRALFSSFAECPEEYYTRRRTADGGRQAMPAGLSTVNCQLSTEYIKAKTHIYELTPFAETLFLDVDMLMLPVRPISETIAELSARCDYTIENRGYADLSQPDEKLDPHYCNWVNILDVKKHYRTKGRFYHLHSEFIFFKKNARNKKFFANVREVYDERPVAWQEFDGGVPDEYAFDIATAVTGHYPHQDSYVAIYWHGMDQRRDWNKYIIRQYIGFSLGGNFIPEWITTKINAYKELFRQSLKLPYLFNVPPKKQWNKKRRLI